MKKPNNEVWRDVTNYNCLECGSPIYYIAGQSSCGSCCLYNVYYYWCDECGEDFDEGELIVKGSSTND